MGELGSLLDKKLLLRFEKVQKLWNNELIESELKEWESAKPKN